MPSLPERIPGAILAMAIPLTDKRILAQVAYLTGSGSTLHGVMLSQAWLASRLRLARRTINRGVQRLVRGDYIQARPSGRVKSYRLSAKLNFFSKNFFLFYIPGDTPIKRSDIVIRDYLKFRQGGKDAAWPKVKTIAADLGLSRQTVISAVQQLERSGDLKVRRVNGGRRQHNSYALHETAFDSSRESRAKKCPTYNNTHKEFKKTTADFSRNCLSAQRMLTGAGVHPAVADSLAQSHSLGDVENAVLNAVGQRELGYKHGRAVKTAAYIVGTLNHARRERHAVPLNHFMAQKKAQFDRLKKPALQTMTAEHIATRKKAVLNPKTLRLLGLASDRIEQITQAIGA